MRDFDLDKSDFDPDRLRILLEAPFIACHRELLFSCRAGSRCASCAATGLEGSPLYSSSAISFPLTCGSSADPKPRFFHGLTIYYRNVL